MQEKERHSSSSYVSVNLYYETGSDSDTPYEDFEEEDTS